MKEYLDRVEAYTDFLEKATPTLTRFNEALARNARVEELRELFHKLETQLRNSLESESYSERSTELYLSWFKVACENTMRYAQFSKRKKE